jgi:hypothetical protein
MSRGGRLVSAYGSTAPTLVVEPLENQRQKWVHARRKVYAQLAAQPGSAMDVHEEFVHADTLATGPPLTCVVWRLEIS